MANRKVTLIRICKTPTGWRRYPVAFGKNGRIKPDTVIVDGTEYKFPEGQYQLRTYQGSRMVYKTVGTNAADAVAAQNREMKLLAARENATAVGAKIVEEPGRVYLRRVIEQYKQDAENRGALEAREQARLVGDEFMPVCAKTFVDEITKDDIYRFHRTLRDRGASPRTISNKHGRLKSILVFAGVSADVLPPSPRYDEKMPTTYTQEELNGILASAAGYLRLVIELGLKCGLREQELMHLEWGDIHWAEPVLRVTSKPHWGFSVKDSEEREIPIPSDLLELLKTRLSENPKTRLVLGTATDRPNTKLLRTLKRLAKRAGLNCKVCAGCKGTLGECQEWTLHKLRRTYATTLLRNSIDLRTVQHYMGHADLASTMRYLRPASGTQAQAAVNAIKWS